MQSRDQEVRRRASFPANVSRTMVYRRVAVEVYYYTCWIRCRITCNDCGIPYKPVADVIWALHYRYVITRSRDVIGHATIRFNIVDFLYTCAQIKAVLTGVIVNFSKVWFSSGGDPVGVMGSWPPSFPEVGSKCARTPHFLVPCCYTWPVIHSISSADSGWTLHARWFLYPVVHETSMCVL